MMKMNIGAWIGIGAGIAGILIGIGSVLSTVPGTTGILVALGILIVFGGMALLFYKLLFGPMINASRLAKTGMRTKATITAVHDTGVTINDNPQVKLTLELKNSFGQRYTTSSRALVSRINPAAYQVGMEVPVLVDPKNEMNVVLDFSNAGSSSYSSNNTNSNFAQPDVTAMKADLEALNTANEALRASGRPARAIVKKYTWLGIYVNGNNPYVELELEVLPEASASFSGKAKGVIGEAAVAKFQPGEEIYVKYDLYDQGKIAIDHS